MKKTNPFEKPKLAANSLQCLYAYSKSTKIEIKEVYTIMDRYEEMHKLTLEHEETNESARTTIKL